MGTLLDMVFASPQVDQDSDDSAGLCPEVLADVARVYCRYGPNHARARLVFHEWTVDEPDMLEAALETVRDFVQRPQKHT